MSRSVAEQLAGNIYSPLASVDALQSLNMMGKSLAFLDNNGEEGEEKAEKKRIYARLASQETMYFDQAAAFLTAPGNENYQLIFGAGTVGAATLAQALREKATVSGVDNVLNSILSGSVVKRRGRGLTLNDHITVPGGSYWGQYRINASFQPQQQQAQE